MTECSRQTGCCDALPDFSCRHSECAGLAFIAKPFLFAGAAAVCNSIAFSAAFSFDANPRRRRLAGAAAY
jgi:hypothetical protein